MSVLDLGDPWVYDFKVYDVNNALADATAFAITVTSAPTGSVATPSFTHVSTGIYRVTFVPDAAGRFSLYGQATGTNACAQPEQIDVRATASTALISLTDAKTFLGIPLTDLSQDEKLRDQLDAVTAWLEKRIGPVIARPVTDVIDFNGAPEFYVLKTPLISLTSITGLYTSALTYNVADFATTPTGRVFRKDTAWLVWGPYTVVYTAGRTTVDSAILEAARVLLQHFWETQRGSGVRPGQGDDGVSQYGDLPIPPRIYTLIQPHKRAGLA